MKIKIKILKIVLVIILMCIILIAPIVVRKIFDLKKEFANSEANRFILEIEKNNLLKQGSIEDGKNIDASKVTTKIKTAIKGKLSIKDGLVENAELIVNGIKVSYYRPKDSDQYKYYVDRNSIYDSVSPTWETYFKEKNGNFINIENTEHILSYTYKNKKITLIMDDKKECETSLKSLSKISEYSNLKCTIKYNFIFKKDLCVVINGETLCFDYEIWNDMKKLKKELIKLYPNNIKCTANSNKIVCKINGKNTLAVVKHEMIRIDDYRCLVYDNKKLECSK